MNRDSIRINTNGQVPLADTSGGAAGALTGAERLKLQTLQSIYTLASYFGLTANNLTINNATTSVAGLHSAADKTKLDGIASGAQVNVLESISATLPLSVGAVSGKNQNITIAAASAGTAGTMSAADKTKLDAAANVSSGSFTGWTELNGQKSWYAKLSLGSPPASPSWNFTTVTLPSGITPNSGLQSLQVTLLGDATASVHLIQAQARVTSGFGGGTVDIILGSYNNSTNLNALITTGYVLVHLVTT